MNDTYYFYNPSVPRPAFRKPRLLRGVPAQPSVREAMEENDRIDPDFDAVEPAELLRQVAGPQRPPLFD
jgi:hypothetical protein